MKNALIFVLLVVVAVLGFLLYKSRSVSKVQVFRYQDYSTKDVDAVECPLRTGQDKKTCVILISYLTGMVNGSVDDYAIRVRHNDTIKWIGDNGESITVPPEMPAVLCSNHAQGVTLPAGADKDLISQISPPGNIVTAHVTGNTKNEKYCYKNTIQVTTVDGKTRSIDPHEFLPGS